MSDFHNSIRKVTLLMTLSIILLETHPTLSIDTVLIFNLTDENLKHFPWTFVTLRKLKEIRKYVVCKSIAESTESWLRETNVNRTIFKTELGRLSLISGNWIYIFPRDIWFESNDW